MPDALPRTVGIDTPCVRVCVIERATGLCAGCLRTIDEIAGWTAMSPEERRRIIAALPARRAG